MRLPIDAKTYLTRQVDRLNERSIDRLKRFGVASIASMAASAGHPAGALIFFEGFRQIRNGTNLIKRRNKILQDLRNG